FDGRIPAGRRVPNVVSLRDLPATVLDLAAVRGPTTIPGTSLTRYWTDAPDDGSVALAQLGKAEPADLARPAIDRLMPGVDSAMVAVFDERTHLLRRTTKAYEEMYAYRVDEKEERNLLGADSASAIADSLRGLIRRALAEDRTNPRLVPQVATAKASSW